MKILPGLGKAYVAIFLIVASFATNTSLLTGAIAPDATTPVAQTVTEVVVSTTTTTTDEVVVEPVTSVATTTTTDEVVVEPVTSVATTTTTDEVVDKPVTSVTTTTTTDEVVDKPVTSVTTTTTTDEVVDKPVTSVATTTTTVTETVAEPVVPEKTTIFVDYQEKIGNGDYRHEGSRLYITTIDGTEAYMTAEGKFYYGGNLHFVNVATFDRLPLGQAIVYQYCSTAVTVGDSKITIYHFANIVNQINIDTGIDARDDMARKSLLLEEYKAELDSGAYSHDETNNRYYIATVEGCTAYMTIDGQFWCNGKLEFENVAILDLPIEQTITYQYCSTAVAIDKASMYAYVYAYGEIVDVIDIATGEPTHKWEVADSRKERIVAMYRACLREDLYRHDEDKRYVAYVNDIECYQTLEGQLYYGDELLYNYFATCDKVDDVESFVYKDFNSAVVKYEDFIYVYSCGEIISVINIHTGNQPKG